MDHCQDSIHIKENKRSPPSPSVPSFLLSAGNWEDRVLGSVSDNRQLNTFAKEKATLHLGRSPLGIRSHSRVGLWPQSSRGLKPECGPTQSTRNTFHYKPRGRRCHLKLLKVKEQSQINSEKNLSSLKFKKKKEVSAPTYKRNILVYSLFPHPPHPPNIWDFSSFSKAIVLPYYVKNVLFPFIRS